MTKDIVLSYSNFSMIGECAERYHLYQTLKPPFVQSKALVVGRYTHQVIENRIMEIDPPSEKSLHGWVKGLELQALRNTVSIWADHAQNLLVKQGWEPMWIENKPIKEGLKKLSNWVFGNIKVYHPMSELYLSGKIDLIVENQFGEIGIIDWKTSRYDYNRYSLLSQQLQYYQLLTSLLDIDISWLGYGILIKDTGAFSYHNRSKFTKTQIDRFENHIKFVGNQIRNNQYFTNSGNYCSWCPFQDRCHGEEDAS